ncbi:prepilin peptidase-dependent protein [Gilliamella sp. B2894]|uniref:prepilin peptidase-dependent protein n=1 Tax=unclassified Gilliamella TaxID=2685620 RepID=UPI00226AC09A|nr:MULTISPECIES: prepilin peptidase-dependent protein [unclassified Gilliamella]MCX8655725.1 prepilin peptidase-dependent protein [Gilliamella sp. B2894]MCX8694730.1 prepilin peptidase-dependent protein [Gilliamella sp. B2881]MCX8695329.1 prepilin peptidase-dependent protein [Gilliamella sp. B2828]
MPVEQLFTEFTAMLKALGFSLYEMLISITLVSLIVIGITSFYNKLQQNTLHHYQLMHLQQTIKQALVGLSKDIKRAGFIADDPTKMKKSAFEIVGSLNCMIIRYDSEIRHDWIDDPWNLNNSDIFTYRFKNNNVEYRTGAVNCKETKWEKLFDPAEIKVTKFDIKQKNNTIELSIGAELKKHKHVKYQITKIIKNENLFKTASE